MASFADLVATLHRIKAAANPGAEAAANAMADVFTGVVQGELGAVGHFLHTKTPSPPGSPPAWISRNLRNSMFITPAAPIGADAWLARSGPTTRYSRIQELGGEMRAHSDRGMRWQEPPGVWHQSMEHSLPARPYMKPGLATVIGSGALEGAAAGAFGAAISAVI